MGELSVHANEVRTCKGCYGRIIWLENAWRKRTAFNVPEGERGKNWLSISDKDRHDCPRKDRLAILRHGT